MKTYTVTEFLKIAEYDEEVKAYFVEADWEDIFITVNKGEEHRNYGMRGDKDGSIIVDGPGEGAAHRYGSGEGDAIRCGSGNGWALRYGSGKGSAYRDGTGNGSAYRDGVGIKSEEVKMKENNCGMCGCNLFIARKDGVECQACGNIIKDEPALQILLSSLMDAKFKLLSLVSAVESNRIRIGTVNQSCIIAFDFYYNDFNGILGIKNCELIGAELKNDAVTMSANIGVMCVVWNNEHVWKPLVETLHKSELLGDIVMTCGSYRGNIESEWVRK